MMLKDLVGCLAWVSAFIACALWLPIIGPAVGILSPLPFFYYTAKVGPKQGVKLTVICIVVLGAIGAWTGLLKVAIMAAEYGVLGYLLSFMLGRKKDSAAIIAVSTVVVSVCAFLTITAISWIKGVSLGDMVRAYLGSELKEALSLYLEGGDSQQNRREIESAVNAVLNVFINLLPSLVLIGTVLVVWVNLVFARLISKIKGLPFGEASPARLWRPPEKLIWPFIVAGFGAVLAEGVLQWVCINALVVTSLVYFFNGLCIVIFMMDKHNAPAWLRIGVYLLIAFQQLFIVVLAVGGIFDQWVDFRKLRTRSAA